MAPACRSCPLPLALLFGGIAVAIVGCSSARRAPPDASASLHADPASAPDAGARVAQARTVEPAHAAGMAERQARGEALYGRMCAICHGEHGEGYRADQATALAQQGFLASVSDQFLDYAINFGRQGTTMSAWGKTQGGPLEADDVAAIVTFLRSWQKVPALPADTRPIVGTPERGKAVFQRACQQCHGRKGPYVRITNRQWLVHASPELIRDAIEKGRPGTKMPAFAQTLDAVAIDDVVAYLRALPNWQVPGETGGPRETPLPLGKVLNPKGPPPRDFQAFPRMTSVDVVGPALQRGARMMLLDARVPSDYLESHIAGAVSVPFYDPSPYVDDLPRDTWLVCYCGCPHAESGALAGQLLELGFKKVTVLDEGLYVWQQRGYPLRSGLEPDAPKGK